MHHLRENPFGGFNIDGSPSAIFTHLAARAGSQGPPFYFTWSTYSYRLTSRRHSEEVPEIPEPQEAQGAAVAQHKQQEENEQTAKTSMGGVKAGPSYEGRQRGEVANFSQVPYKEDNESVQSGEESNRGVARDSSSSPVVQEKSRAEAPSITSGDVEGSDGTAGGQQVTQAKAAGNNEGLPREHGAEPGSDVEIIFADTASLSPPLPQRAPQKGHQGDEGEVFACDRSNWRTDVCRMRGDVRVKGDSQVLWLFSRDQTVPRGTQKIKPYPRKQDPSSMSTVTELVLKCIDDPTQQQQQQEQPLPVAGQGEGTGGGSRRLLKARSNPHEHPARLLAEEKEEGGQGSSQLKVLAERNEGGAQASSREGSAQLGEWRGDEEAEWDRSPFLFGCLREWKERKWLGAWRVNETRAVWGPDSLEVPPPLACDVRHRVPAVVFSLTGFSGNTFHDFTDCTRPMEPLILRGASGMDIVIIHLLSAPVAPVHVASKGEKGPPAPQLKLMEVWAGCAVLIPLWITVQQYEREVVFILSDAQNWVIHHYWELLDEMSNYPPVLLGQEPHVHCFPEVIVGLYRSKGDLAVDPKLMPNNETIHDFQAMLRRAWDSKVTIIARTGTRSLTNQETLVELAEGLGFAVRILIPTFGIPPLADMWGHMQCSAVVMGVHGAGLTHMLFMRPGSFLIQVVPFGLKKICRDYFGNPAIKLGLHYVGYNITVKESTLSEIYPADDPVFTDPGSIIKKGWGRMAAMYLDNQNVTLSKARVAGVLKRVMNHLVSDAPALSKYC
eukprot:jgi/Mesen1/9974/ME000072S09387